jgi:hypothetical protein
MFHLLQDRALYCTQSDLRNFESDYACSKDHFNPAELIAKLLQFQKIVFLPSFDIHANFD